MVKKNNNQKITGDKDKITRDRPIKSVVKTITWRLIASAATFAIALLFLGSDPQAMQKATGIAIAESLIKMVFYFLHERAWAQLRWGRMLVVIRRNTRISRRSNKKHILKRA